MITNRDIRDAMNALEEHQLDYPATILWTDSDQNGYVKRVEVDGDGYVEFVA